MLCLGARSRSGTGIIEAAAGLILIAVFLLAIIDGTALLLAQIANEELAMQCARAAAENSAQSDKATSAALSAFHHFKDSSLCTKIAQPASKSVNSVQLACLRVPSKMAASDRISRAELCSTLSSQAEQATAGVLGPGERSVRYGVIPSSSSSNPIAPVLDFSTPGFVKVTTYIRCTLPIPVPFGGPSQQIFAACAGEPVVGQIE